MAKRKSKTIEQPNWRPNFRIQETLPDTKVIRTDFLFNFVGLSLAVILLGYLIFQQTNISTLKGNIEDVETQIAGLEAANNKALKQSAEFKRNSKQIEEINKFMATPVNALDLLLEISKNTPKGITLNSITYSPTPVLDGKKKSLVFLLMLNATSQAESSEVTQLIDGMQKSLSESELLKNFIKKSELRSFSRDNKLGTFTMQLAFELKGDRS